MHRVPRSRSIVVAWLLLALVASSAPSARAAPAAELGGDIVLGTVGPGRGVHARDAVVWLDQVPERVARPSTGRGWPWRRAPVPPLPLVTLSALRFEPRVLAITNGSSVVFKNADKVWHGTFSVSPAQPFELGKRSPGQIDTVRFVHPGVIALRCDIHPEMSAYIVVTPNRVFARPDSTGQWRLGRLPAGRYVVRAWHPARGELSRTVDVPAKGTVRTSLRW